MSSTIQTVVTIAGVVVGILYILSIIYVIKDARNRGTNWPVWAVISLIPLIGFIAYCVARPPLTIEIAMSRILTWRSSAASSCSMARALTAAIRSRMITCSALIATSA